MTIYFYYVIAIIMVIAMGTMMIHLKRNTVLSKEGVFYFSLSYIALMISIVVQMLGVMCYFDMFTPEFHALVTFFELSVTPFVPVLLSFSCGIVKPARYVGAAMLLHVILEVVLFPFGGIYSIDASNVYHRGPFYIIYILSYMISAIYMIISFRLVAMKFRNRDGWTLISLTLVAIVSISAAIVDGKIYSGIIGSALGAILLYIYYEDLSQQDLLEDNERKARRIQEMQSGTIMGMAKIIESRDGSTGEHVKHSAEYVALLAREAQKRKVYSHVLTDEFVNLLINAAPLHDIGKIAIPDSILNKPGRFTDEEFEIMKSHAVEGGRIILDVLEGLTDHEFTKMAAEIATYHQEKWNGTGYPKGLKGEEIPLSARFMAIADVYDALVARRVYKAGMPREKALSIIAKDAGVHFDPILAPIFVDIMKDGDPVRDAEQETE